MASTADDAVPEGEKPGETTYEEINLPASPEGDWSSFSSYSDIFEAYDTVLQIKNGSRGFEISEAEELSEEVLIPDREAYDSEGESLDKLAEELEGDTLVVALGLEGQNLPNYRELQDSETYAEGNWWDNPEELDADYLFDRRTYEGAVDPNGFDSEPITQADGLDRGLYLFRQV
jgi:hypothetical protein